MSVSSLAYDLHAGYIHDWLIAGPFVGSPSEQPGSTEFSSAVTTTPTEGSAAAIAGAEVPWQHVRCLDDHFVDLSSYGDDRRAQFWAYAREILAGDRRIFTSQLGLPASTQEKIFGGNMCKFLERTV